MMHSTPEYSGIFGLYWGYIGIMEKKMETSILEQRIDWSYIGGFDQDLHSKIPCRILVYGASNRPQIYLGNFQATFEDSVRDSGIWCLK